MGRRALTNVLCDACDVDVIERGVDLVHDEEWRRAVLVAGKEESEGGDGALPARELVHVTEALHARVGLKTGGGG